MLSEFEIVDDLADRRVDRLSMGQRQRVRLGMTFLHEPTIVFLDEPQTSLDKAGVALLNAALARLVDRGGAVVLASPEPSLPFAGQSWILQTGELHAADPGAAEADRPETPRGDFVTSSALRS